MGSLGDFFTLLLKAISFYPASIQLFFGFVISFFGVFLVGRILNWLWDVLPTTS